MGVADGFAALVGTLLNNTHRYKVLGHFKSREGTATFFISLIILTACAVIGGLSPTVSKMLILAALTTVLENVSVAGTDNLFVPLAVVVFITA